MRALFVLVVVCLVSAVRPAPIAHVTGDARVDTATSQADFVPSRRITVEPRHARSPIDGIVTPPHSITPPVQFAFVELHALDGLHGVPGVCSRSARGPPIS